MFNKIYVPISINTKGEKKVYRLHEVRLFPKGAEDKAWVIKDAGKEYSKFLKELKAYYFRSLEDDYKTVVFELDPHIQLPESAESVLLGICAKAEKEIKRQGINPRWTSVTITGKVVENDGSFYLKEARDIDEKYDALVKMVKEESGGKKTDFRRKHFFAYVNDKEKDLAREDNIHIKFFPKNHPLREFLGWLFVPTAISSEEGLYFENHTIYDRFDQIYKDIRRYNRMKENEMPYYINDKDTDKISFTKEHYWNLIPADIRKEDKENCERYRDLFFDEIGPYMDSPVMRFFKKAPFLIVEHYFYYDILRKFCIRKQDDTHRAVFYQDPYKRGKKFFGRKITKSDILKSNLKEITGEDIAEILKTLIDITSTDQSQIHHRWNIKTSDLIIDNREEFLDYLKNQRKHIKRIDIILDNYGLEFIYVIQLAMNIIKYCEDRKDITIYFHLKVWPIYVSDVVLSKYGNDVGNIKTQIRIMSKGKDKPFILQRLHSLEKSKRIMWQPDMFWNSHLPFRNMPEKLKNGFDKSDLIIVMSDLNYRKLIEDRDWPCDTEIRDRIQYLSTPVLIVRALKSNSLINISLDKAKEYKEKYDSEWRTTGQVGIIQFVNMREHAQ
jgi:hypothetical protein